MLRLRRQAMLEAEHEAEERGKRGESPPTIRRGEAKAIEVRMRAENPTLTLAGTQLPFQFPLDPAERMMYGTHSKVEGKLIFADTLHGEYQFVVGLS
eukprot:273588-Pleurochrysis_carterae.AAC.1